MAFRPDGPKGDEASKIKHLIPRYTRGHGLDVGCGPWKAYPHMIGVDWLRGAEDLPAFQTDVQLDAKDLSIFGDNSLDFVFSSHMLEHVEDVAGMLGEWWRVIKTGGHLILYLPHAKFFPKKGEKYANDDHKHDFVPADIVSIMEKVGSWDLVERQDRNEREEYSFYLVFRKETGTRRHGHSWKDKLNRGKTALVVRYGGVGDMVQTSSVLAGLKKQGYHITLNSHPNGEYLLRHDPNIDAFIVQDPDQVPKEWLSDYWKHLEYEFDKCVNLSESVEGTLLALEGRRTHALPMGARHMIMNTNYMDFMHAIGEVPNENYIGFYPTKAEQKKMMGLRDKMGNVPVIVWSLSGSSIHKTWPWVPEVICWLMQHTNATVVLIGGKECQLLECGICQNLMKHYYGMSAKKSDKMKLSEMLLEIKKKTDGVNRILCKSGNWNIREVLTFLEYTNIVVGPETGVLNAASVMPMAKVVMLSHSSHDNLTRDWVNTTVLEPVNTPCYPCHRMHYNRKFCPEDKPTGASMCAASIEPGIMMAAIVDCLKRIGVKEAA